MHEFCGDTDAISGENGEEIIQNDEEISPNEQHFMCPDLGGKSSSGLPLQHLPRRFTLGSARLHDDSAPEIASPARRGSGDSTGDTQSPLARSDMSAELHQSAAATRLLERRWQAGGPRCYERRQPSASGARPRADSLGPTGSRSGVDPADPSQSSRNHEAAADTGSSSGFSVPLHPILRALKPHKILVRRTLLHQRQEHPVRDRVQDPLRPELMLHRLRHHVHAYKKGVMKLVNYKTKFGLACCSTGEPNTIEEALDDARWKKAMEEEHMAL